MRKRNSDFNQYLVIIAAIVIIAIAFCILSPTFRTYTTVVTMMGYMYYILLMAIGVTFPLITGGVDLTMGTGLICYAVAGYHFVSTNNLPIGFALVVIVLMAVGFGAVNGILVTKFNLPAFLVTLCTMMVTRGIGTILSGGRSVSFPRAGEEGDWIVRIFRITTDSGFIIPIGLVWMIILMIIMHIILRHTCIGRYILAIGSNKEAFRLSGMSVFKWQVVAYIISGLFTGLAGIAYGATFSTVLPGSGGGFELDAISGAIIGGTSMSGGKGSIFGTFLGVVLISLLKTGLPFVGLQANWQQIVTGCILLFAIAVGAKKDSKRA